MQCWRWRDDFASLRQIAVMMALPDTQPRVSIASGFSANTNHDCPGASAGGLLVVVDGGVW
jgi:hypothetical protein